MHKAFRFYLDIRYEQFLSVYRGTHSSIRTKTLDGRIIEFPARNAQPFLTRNGINGLFEMTLTAENKFVALKKIA